jgi:hypothetical protein
MKLDMTRFGVVASGRIQAYHPEIKGLSSTDHWGKE